MPDTRRHSHCRPTFESVASAGRTALVTIVRMQSICWTERIYLIGCRLAGYAMLNLADDAAMLALVFC